jgi:hypothetical protein
MKRYIALLLCGIALMLIGCAPTLPNRSGLQAATAIPTLAQNDPVALCAAVNAAWGNDWSQVIDALQALQTLDTPCADGLALNERLYTAYAAYGTVLEQEGRTAEAITAYQQALTYNPNATTMRTRLAVLGAATPLPPAPCEVAQVDATLAQIPAYTPTQGSFVRVQEGRFTVDDVPYAVYGVNYYPRDTPFAKFLTTTDPTVYATEMNLIRAAGIRVLRVFVWYEGLFICAGNGAVPEPAALARLDALIAAAAVRNMRLIVVLHDSPDLQTYPLYTSSAHITAQTEYLVTRYAAEPAIMAWDLRDSGDVDYLGLDGAPSDDDPFPREAVLTWLAETALLIRQHAPNHLITAGWRRDNEVTAPIVDFVSFQHFGDIDELRQRIANLQAQTDKPILLAAIGYSTMTLNESQQRTGLQLALQAVRNTGLGGWVIYSAFDYPTNVFCETPDCTAEDRPDFHYGLWNTSYFPKLSLDAVILTTGGA